MFKGGIKQFNHKREVSHIKMNKTRYLTQSHKAFYNHKNTQEHG